MMDVMESSFGLLTICLLAYQAGVYIHSKIKTSLLNPLLISVVIMMVFLSIFNISQETFDSAGSLIEMLLLPATILLAVPMYHQRARIKQNILPVLVGSVVGVAAAFGSVYVLCRLFNLDLTTIFSLMPKSTTTAISLEISKILGGVQAITVVGVVFTGMFGTILAPLLIKIFRIKEPVAQGMAIGGTSHALGTSRAVEIGEVQGAFSGIAVSTVGLTAVVVALFLH